MTLIDIQLAQLAPSCGIKGVSDVRQKRSLAARDALLDAGIDMLNERRFSEIRIVDLAAACDQSVGGFYARFEDKEAYFRALQATVFPTIDDMVTQRFSVDQLSAGTLEQGLDHMVDLLVDIFTARWRGFLRESLLQILEPGDPWEPARESARRTLANAHEGLASKVPAPSIEQARERISFCFQTAVGVIQNDLVNDYHVYSTREGTLRHGLKAMLGAYITAPTSGDPKP